MIVRYADEAWTADCTVGGLFYADGFLRWFVRRKNGNGSRIAWTGMVRYVEGAWTGHWRDTDGAKTDWKLIPDSKWLFRNCSVMFP